MSDPLTRTPPLLDFQVSHDIRIVVSTSGWTDRNYVDGWLIRESGKRVQVLPVEEWDDESTWREPIYEFNLPTKATFTELAYGPVSLSPAKTLAIESLMSIARHELGSPRSKYQHHQEIRGSIRIESDLIREDAEPVLLIAEICDALADRNEWLWATHDENMLYGEPTFDMDIEIPLGPTGNNDRMALDRLKAAADHFQASYLDVVKSVDDAAVIISLLPSLVAVPYTHINTTRTFKDRFDSLLQTFEAVVRYMATVALIPVAGDDRETRLQGLATHGRTPSLGKYVEIVRNNLESLRGLLPEVVRALEGPSGKQTPLGSFIFDELVDMRNQVGPHGGNRPDGAYVEPAQTLNEELDEIVALLAKDANSTVLVVQTDVKVGEKGSTFDYDLIELRTDKVYPPRGKFSSDQKLEEGKVYLLHSPSSHFILADPLVRYDVCPTCNLDEAFFLDHFGPKAPQWFTYRGGHRIP